MTRPAPSAGGRRDPKLSRTLGLAMVGAVAAVSGERWLGRMPARAIAVVVAGALAYLGWRIWRGRSSGGAVETVGTTIAVSVLGAGATVAANRLVRDEVEIPVAIAVAAVVVAVFVVLWWRASRRARSRAA